MPDKDYTKLWTENFKKNSVRHYDNKFKLRWEKNIKHREQILFIRKYIKEWMYWCDCPIGSGRLMDELRTENFLGIDVSGSFIEYNQEKGVKCIKEDIFNVGSRFPCEFDILSSLHTIFAFTEYRKILEGFIYSLKKGGILIVDIVNKEHQEQTMPFKINQMILGNSDPFPIGMTKDEILQFFQAKNCDVLEICPHDFWDNDFILRWRKNVGGSKIGRRVKSIIWRLVNKAYFGLDLFNIFHNFEKGRPDYRFTKYLVAIRKR